MNKSRIFGTALLVLVLFVTATSLASALATGTADKDAYVYASAGDSVFNTVTVRVEAGDTTCAQARWSFLQWDLSDIAPGTTLASAKVTLYVSSISGDPSGAHLELHKVLNDAWEETTLTYNNPIATSVTPGDPATLLQSVPAPTAVNDAVTFDSAALLQYAQQQADGDNVASFALFVNGNCGNGTTLLVAMYSEESTTAPDELHKPYALFKAPPPNAVDLTKTSAEQTNSLPLYAGLGFLALVAVAGVVVSRRRMAVR